MKKAAVKPLIFYLVRFYSRFFANALPEGLFKYASKSRAFWRSEKAMAVLIRQGLSLAVWGLLP